MNAENNLSRPQTPMGAQAMDPQLLQNMLVALTNLQIQLSSDQKISVPRDPRVPDVPIFNGNKAQYSIFLARLKNFFAMQPTVYDSDKKKIGYVISRLEGSAADWAVTLLENPDYECHVGLMDDWQLFLDAFSKFSDPFAKRNATDALLSLTQGKSQSVLSYWTKFSELLYRSNISPDSAKPLFERGLKYEIRDRLVDKDLSDDLDSYVTAVVDLDNRLYRLRQDKKISTFNSSGFVPRFPSTSTNSTSGVIPMDIGALDSRKAVVDSKERWDEIRRMAPEERRKTCFEEERCHYCKRIVGNPPSHLAQTCPLKQNKSKSDYLQVSPEVHPRKGVPDSSYIEGIPQRQVFSLSNPDMNFKKNVTIYSGSRVVSAQALVDSGAMGYAYIDRKFAEQNNLPLKHLDVSVEIKTVDGSPCGSGLITQKVIAVIDIVSWKDEVEFHVISSPSVPIILGWEWLKEANPIINWKKGSMSFCKGTPDYGDGVPQRQVFIDLIGINSRNVQSETDMNLEKLISEYKEIFSSEEFPKLAPNRPGIDIDLQLIEGKAPPFGPIYSLSKDEELALRKYLEGAMDAGLIRKSTSPAGSPVMFVKKSDGTLRLCVDYRALNSVLKTDRTALPIIKDMLQRTKGSQVFSKIDLKSAFYLIRIMEGKEYLTAFRTKYGHYEYNVMPFGLKNAPGTFQGFMNYIFADLIDRGVLVYIDDLLLYSNNSYQHMILLEEVFKRIRKYELIVNKKKCVFLAKKVSFLGHVLSDKGIEMDGAKLEVIETWKFPNSVKQMRSFLGLANYYRDFIPMFSKIAAPLFDLTKSSREYICNEMALNSFEELKSAFRKENVLMFPDQELPFYLEVDASDFAIGGALNQIDQVSQKLRPVGFFSRKLSGPEQNYEIYDKELLAIVEAFKIWRYLLIGTNEPVIVYTDHRNLEYFSTARILNRRQARWSQFLADFNFKLKYRKGSCQVVADALSRRDEHNLTEEDRQQNVQVLLPEDVFVMDTEGQKEMAVTGDFKHKERGSNFSICHLNNRDPPINQLSKEEDSDEQDRSKKKVRFNIPIQQLTQRKDFNLLRMPLQMDDIIGSTISKNSGCMLNAIDSSAETSSENSDYDATGYESTVPDSDSEEGVSTVGDVAQFMEFQGTTQSEDPMWFQYLLRYLWDGELPMVLPFSILKKIKLLSKSFLFKNDRLFKKIIRNQQLYHVPYIPFMDRDQLIHRYHHVLGHMQVNTLLPLMEVRYFWPFMERDIKNIQDSCPQCQLNGTAQITNHRPLQPHDPVGIPFLKWGIDFVQDLPEVNGYSNIFTARCYATKRVIYVATKDRTAKTAAECIFKDIVCKYGSPAEIVSDRGFMDSVLGEYFKLLEIHHLPSAAYSPQTNGLDERGHQDLKNIITKLSDGDPFKWTKILPLAEFILNSRISNSTGFSAFYLSHGFEPKLPGDDVPALPPGYYDLTDNGDIALLSSKELARLGQNRAAALQRLKAQAIRMKAYYDKKLGVKDVSFKVGDVVKMVNHSKTKFKFKFIGPFYIADKGPNNSFFLMRPDGRRWTSQNGTDTPVNPDHLALFNEYDAEYYYDGNN